MNYIWPLRAKNEADFPTLKKIDKQIIAAAVLLQLDNQSAFALYHPEYIDGTGRLNAAGKQDAKFFWNYGKNKEYRQSYEQTVQEFLNGKKKTKVDVSEPSESRRDKAEGIYRDKVYTAIEAVDPTDIDSMKTVGDLGKTVKIFKEEEERQIAPIRVLVARCKSECNYCFFVETAKAKGLMFDSCDYCKARKIAEKHGFKFDHCTLLDVPPEVVEEIESHNDVKLTDILDNGQMTRADIEKQFNELDSDEQNN